MTTVGLIIIIVLVAAAIAIYRILTGSPMPTILERLLYVIVVICFVLWILGILGVAYRLP